MTVFKIVSADSRRGRRLIDGLERRGATVLDPKVTERAGHIVDAVRHGGDRALLKAVRRYDHSSARSIDELRQHLSHRPGGARRLEEVSAGRRHGPILSFQAAMIPGSRCITLRSSSITRALCSSVTAGEKSGISSIIAELTT